MDHTRFNSFDTLGPCDPDDLDPGTSQVFLYTITGRGIEGMLHI